MPCLDCNSRVADGMAKPVYQPYPLPAPVAIEVCLQIGGEGDPVNVIKLTTYQRSTDCESTDCLEICSEGYYLNGVEVMGLEVTCPSSTSDPLVVGFQELCSGTPPETWTSPECAVEIVVDVQVSNAVTLTVPPNPAVPLPARTTPYTWGPVANEVISPITIDTGDAADCVSITFLQSGLVAIPEAWVVDDLTADNDSPGNNYLVGNGIRFNGKMYLTTASGVLRNDGTGWTNVLSGATTRTIVEDSGNLYVTRGGDVYISTDDGLTFSLFDTPPVGNLTGIAVYSGEIYVTSNSSGSLYRRTAPATWSTIAYGSATTAGYMLEVFNGRLWMSANASGGSPNNIYYWDGAIWTALALPSGGKFQGTFGVHSGELWYHDIVSNDTFVIDTLDAITVIPQTPFITGYFSNGVTFYAVDSSNNVYTATKGGGYVAFQAISPSYTTGYQVVDDVSGVVYASGRTGANRSTEFYQAAQAGSCS